MMVSNLAVDSYNLVFCHLVDKDINLHVANLFKKDLERLLCSTETQVAHKHLDKNLC
jgi:hypothetical protein